MNKLLQTQSDSATRFLELVRQGMALWLAAGELAATEIDKDASWVDKVCACDPDMPPGLVRRFEAIGRHKLHPRLAYLSGAGPQRLRMLPLQLQERCLAQPIEVVIYQAGKTDLLLIDVCNLTPRQAEQVFARDGVRDAAAQRAWLADREGLEQSRHVKPDVAYKLTKHELVVLQPCRFAAKDLAVILARLQ
jgi:hypothetical protein